MLKWLSKLRQKDRKGEKKRVTSASSDKQTTTEISKINSVEVGQDILHSVSSYGPLNPQCHEQWRKNEKQCPGKVTNSYYISTENSMKDVEVSTNDIDTVNPGDSIQRQNCLFHPVPIKVYPKLSSKEFINSSDNINNVRGFLANRVHGDDCTKVSNSEVNTGNVITENGVVSLDNVEKAKYLVKRSGVNNLENGNAIHVSSISDRQTASAQSHSDIHLQKNGQTLINNVASPCSFNTVHSSSLERREDLIHNPITLTINNFSENTIYNWSKAENVNKLQQPLKMPNNGMEKKTPSDTKVNSKNSKKVNYQNENDQDRLLKQLPVSVNADQEKLVSDTAVKPKESLTASDIFCSSVKESTKKKDEMSTSMPSMLSTQVNASKCEGLPIAEIPKTLDNTDAQPKLPPPETNDTYLGCKNELEVEMRHVAHDYLMKDLKNSSQSVTALYNHEGKICTMSNQRYIRTVLPSSSKLLYIHIKVREIRDLGTKVGCLVLWRGQSPIPLSTIRDGSIVKFDAIFIPEYHVFQALVIWDFDKSKPKFVTEPSTRSYMWIDSRVLLCDNMVIQAKKSFVLVNYDQEKIQAEFLENVVFINGKKASFTELHSHQATSLKPIYATVCRLMTARKGGEFLYICSCVWSGLRPLNDMSTNKFQRGEVYRLNSDNTFVPNTNSYRLYCDWPCELNMTKQECSLEFEVEDSKVLQSLTTNKIFAGNHRAKPCLPLNVQVTAHIQMVSKSKWVVWHVQLPTNETDSDIPSEKVHTKPENEECSKPLKSIPLENKQVLSDLPRKNAKQSQPTEKTLSNIKQNQTAVVNDATGILICVKGNYGILGIRHKSFGVSGEVWVSFHRSVAYVDRLPFYKDVSFDEQMEDLLSYTWHCSISRKDHIVDDLSLKYEATLAWQGQKPTKEDLEYFRSEPSDVYYAASDTQDTIESLVFYNSNRDISAQELTRASSACTSKVDGTMTVFSSTESLPTDETQNLAVDDMDLFPTLALDEERDIVEVRSPKRKDKFK